jgi:hypothetical protein
VGTLRLVGLLAAGSVLLSLVGRPRTSGLPTLAGIGIADAARRRMRTPGADSVLACGILIVTAVSANRIGVRDPRRRDSGTGEFGLYAETSLPIGEDRLRRLAAGDLAGLSVIGLRVLDSDDTSCLNLNRVARTAVLGVNPSAMRGRFAFAGFLDESRPADPWQLLDRDLGPDTIAGFADASVMKWGSASGSATRSSTSTMAGRS